MTIDERMDVIFRHVCNLKETTGINDAWYMRAIDEWDSVAMFELTAALEKEFSIEFDYDDLLEMTNWGVIKRLVQKKIEG
jgi:hypothetical protein